MKWKTIQEIKEYFKIDQSISDLKQIRDELKYSLSQLHPDKSNGEFKTAWQKEEFNKINDAVEFIDKISSTSTSLITIENVNEIIKTITQTLQDKKEPISTSSNKELKKEYKKELNQTYSKIKIGSGSIACISTALLSMSQFFSENKVLEPFYKIPQIHLILLSLLILSGIWFLLTWFGERKEEQRKEWLFSEEGKIGTLSSVLRSNIIKEEEDIKYFSVIDYIKVLRLKKSYYSIIRIKRFIMKVKFALIGNPRLSQNLAEQIAQSQLNDFENRGIIKRSAKKSVETLFEIDKEYCEQIEKNYYYFDLD